MDMSDNMGIRMLCKDLSVNKNDQDDDKDEVGWAKWNLMLLLVFDENLDDRIIKLDELFSKHVLGCVGFCE